jgi:hypothetical protein
MYSYININIKSKLCLAETSAPLLLYLLKVLFKLDVKVIKPSLQKTGWKVFIAYAQANIDLDLLTAKIKSSTGVFEIDIDKTPHFNFAKQELDRTQVFEGLYLNYIGNHFPEKNLNTSVNNFSNLCNRVASSESVINPILVKYKLFPRRRIIIYDGLHRASIYSCLGKKKIPVYFVF